MNDPGFYWTFRPVVRHSATNAPALLSTYTLCLALQHVPVFYGDLTVAAQSKAILVHGPPPFFWSCVALSCAREMFC